MQKKLTAIDVFSGAGGMSLGAEMAGISPVFAVEFDKYAANTYSKNHPETIVLQQDISLVNPNDYIKEEPFLLFGGPPCQGFSAAIPALIYIKWW